MESRLSAKLDRIEEHLALLEASSTQPAPMTSEFTLVGVRFCFTLSNSFLIMFKATCKYMAHKYREKFKIFDYLKLEKIATVLLQSIPTILTYISHCRQSNTSFDEELNNKQAQGE